MTSVDLRNTIIDKLNIANDALLNDVLALIEFENSEEIYHLNESQQKAIEEGLNDIKHNRIFTNDEVIQEIDLWLKK